MAIDKVLDDKRNEILSVAERFGARKVRVFGSRARGEGRPDSDVDLLVSVGDRASLLDIIAIKQDLEDLLGCKVDVVTEDSISPYLRDQVLSEAVSL
jgi:hypothetical protein